MKSRLHVLGIAFVVIAGLLTPGTHAMPPPMPPLAALVHTVDHAVKRAELKVDAQHAESTRALDAAVHQVPAMSLDRKQALVRCIDHHLACTRLDLVAAIEARDQAPDDRLATLADVEIGEYRVTHARLLELRRVVTS